MSESLLPFLQLWLCPGVSARLSKQIIDACPDIAKLSDFLQTSTQGREILQRIASLDKKDLERPLEWLAQDTLHHIIPLNDPCYPAALQQIPDPPTLLFIRGNACVIDSLQVAIVGSRHPSPVGLDTASQFSAELARCGYTITSGLAIGIDSACHRAALSQDGCTIAVMGTGIDQIYPKRNQKLAEHIVDQQGALVSELPLGTPPRAQQFPRRNRIVAGLCQGLLVVEAKLNSGSLISAKLACDYNRDVFAIPGSIRNPLSQGCHYLIRQGAQLLESAQQLIEELGHFTTHNTEPNRQKLAYEGELLVKSVGYEPTSLEVIMARTGLDAATLGAQLLDYELRGIIIPVPGGYMRKL